MAICEQCNHEMKLHKSCKTAAIEIDGVIYKRIPWGDEDQLKGMNTESLGPCHDCGVLPGGYHHLNCDMEQCPNCGRQYISCEC
ncbi:MAG: hypothetical protein ABFD08_15260 [Syntrophomonas sp.]